MPSVDAEQRMMHQGQLSRKRTNTGWKTLVFLILGGVLGLTSACNTDDDNGNSQPTPTGTSVTASFQGGTSTTEVGQDLKISLSVLINGKAAPAGTKMTLLEQACISAPPSDIISVGEFAERGAAPFADCGHTDKIISSGGSAQAQFTCQDVGSSNIIVSVGGENAGLFTVTCVAGPDGDWSVSSVTRNSGSFRTGGKSVSLTALVVDGAGEPVPENTDMTLSIVDGDAFTFANGGTDLRRDTNSDGEVTFGVVTGNTVGSAKLRIEFDDPRYGDAFEQTFDVRDVEVLDTEMSTRVLRNNREVTPEERKVRADGVDFLDLEAMLIPPSDADFDLEGNEVVFRVAGATGHFGTEGEQVFRANTDASGVARARFYGGTSADSVTINISAEDPNPNPSEEGGRPDDYILEEEIGVAVIALGAFRYEGATSPVLFVKGGGNNESSTLTFKVLDTLNVPLVGVDVDFKLVNPPAGVTLTNVAGVSNSQGLVSTTISSGSGSGTVNVVARAELGQVEISAPTGTIPIIGSKPNRGGFDLQCNYRNVGAFIGRLGDRIVVDNEYTCSSLITDRFRNPVGTSVVVTYHSEGGTVRSPRNSSAWDYESTPTPPINVGRVATTYNPRGDNPPCDVDPWDNTFVDSLGAEPRDEIFLNYEFDLSNPDECRLARTNCPAITTCTHNPRDGLVTIIAVTRGEEEFGDLNSNGVYDAGEPFWDQGEPFVDVNDNNKYDVGEYFEDTDDTLNEELANGEYDGPNNTWDPVSNIWTSAHILLTGPPSLGDGVTTDGLDPEGSFHDAYRVFHIRYAYIDDEGVTQSVEDSVSFRAGRAAVYELPTDTIMSSLIVSREWFDRNWNRLNASARYSARIQTDNPGFSIDTFSEGSLLDGMGFPLEYDKREKNPSVNSFDYIVKVGVENQSYGHRYTTQYRPNRRVPPEEVACPFTLKFSVNYSVHPGFGGSYDTDDLITFTGDCYADYVDGE